MFRLDGVGHRVNGLAPTGSDPVASPIIAPRKAAGERNGHIRHTDPEHPLLFCVQFFRDCWTVCSVAFPDNMYIIQALHPDGWRGQGTAQLEYWAYQEAQARCCSDGRNYRIIESGTNQVVALIDTSSCRVDHPALSVQDGRGARNKPTSTPRC